MIGTLTPAYGGRQDSSRSGTPPFNVCTAKLLSSGKPCATAPRAIYTPDPEYSEQARKAGHEGTSVLWVLVGADGTVQAARVARPTGMGLDEEALKAVQKWKFKPAEYQGKAVPVQINIEVHFRLPQRSK